MRNLRLRSVHLSFVSISLVLFANAAFAQATQAPLDLQLHDLPLASDDDEAPADFATDTGASVHGSFTSGIGYSKNFGNSTYNAAELDVSKTTDSGRVVDLHIGVQRETGVPYGIAPDYVRRYPDR